MTQPNDEDVDRELEELLSELRVVLPAVTVIFAFLLTVPFTQRFKELRSVDHTAFFVAFLCTAGSVILLVAESAYHRLRGKPYDKRHMLRTASRQAITATFLLAVALAAAVFLVTDVLYDGWIGVPVAAVTFVASVAIWFGLPLVRRLRGKRQDARR